MNLKEYRIKDWLPSSLKFKDLVELAEVIDEKHLELDENQALIYPNIDTLDEDLLNYLGKQQHVERFKESLSKESKRGLIKNSFLLHKRKGTVWAVKTAISEIFAPAQVKEWYQYNGRPYYFKPLINLTDARVAISKSDKAELLKIIDETKNVRSWLDGIEYLIQLEDWLNVSDSSSINLHSTFYERFRYQLRVRYPSTYPFTYIDEMDIDELNFDTSFVMQDSYPNIFDESSSVLKTVLTDTSEVNDDISSTFENQYYEKFTYKKVNHYPAIYPFKFDNEFDIDELNFKQTMTFYETIYNPEYGKCLYGEFKYGVQVYKESQKEDLTFTPFDDLINESEDMTVKTIKHKVYGRLQYKFKYGDEENEI